MLDLLKLNIKVMYGTRKYYFVLLNAAVTAVMSIIVIKLLIRQYQVLNVQFLEMLEASGNINLFVIRVKNIDDILNLTGTDMLYLCFSGLFLPVVTAISTITYIENNYKSGMIRYVVMRGYGRHKIILSEMVITSLGVIGIVLVYLVVSVIGGNIVYGAGVFHLKDSICFVLEQIGIYIVFNCVCVAVTHLLKNEVMTIVATISLIITLPDATRYLTMFLNGVHQFEQLWILNYSNQLAIGDPYPVNLGILCGLIYIIGAVAIGLYIFQKEEIR